MGESIHVGHRQPDGTRWDEWETGRVPWRWTAVCRDPVIEVQGRSLAELRRRESAAVKRHERGTGCPYASGRTRLEGHLQDVAFNRPALGGFYLMRDFETVDGWPKWSYGGRHD
jgi:hypothetical protein